MKRLLKIFCILVSILILGGCSDKKENTVIENQEQIVQPEMADEQTAEIHPTVEEMDLRELSSY